MYENKTAYPLSSQIFSMKGDDWRKIRSKISPTFTSQKMKSMFGIMVNNCQNLIETVDNALVEKGSVLDIKEILMRFTADIIGSSSFGIECNSLKEPNSEFVEMVGKIANHSWIKLLKLAMFEGLQNPGNIEKIAYDDKSVEDFFSKLVKDTVKYRDEHKVVRNDFLNILMQMRETPNGITLDEIVAEAYIFFIAGFKTSALTLSYCIYELSRNQRLQQDIRRDIYTNLGRDSSQYSCEDALSLPCLDKVVKETMRKYPLLPMLNRVTVKPYRVPDTDVVLETGTLVVIPILGLQKDSEYFPDPLKFDPERFSSDNTFVPFTYLPFGEGPRNCVGLRFGLMQLKLGLASLLNSFKFEPASDSGGELVIDPSTTSILLNVLDGFPTRVVKI